MFVIKTFARLKKKKTFKRYKRRLKAILMTELTIFSWKLITLIKQIFK